MGRTGVQEAMTSDRSSSRASRETCVFCQIVRGEARARVVLDDTGVLAFFPLKPAVIGHVLIIPKHHVANVWGLDVPTAHLLAGAALRVGRALQTALQPEGLNFIQSNGEAATQTVHHLHVHAVPRWANDPIVDFWPEESPWTTDELNTAQQQISERM